MTRAVVLADTHMPRRGKELPQQVVAELDRADLIVHLGDFTSITVVRMLQSYSRLVAVFGNNDCADIRAQFPPALRLTLGRYTVSLIHGHLGGRTALQSAKGVTDSNVVLFGHSHRAYCDWVDGILLFNPGSPTDRRGAPSRSFGLLEIGETIEARIVLVP